MVLHFLCFLFRSLLSSLKTFHNVANVVNKEWLCIIITVLTQTVDNGLLYSPSASSRVFLHFGSCSARSCLVSILKFLLYARILTMNSTLYDEMCDRWLLTRYHLSDKLFKPNASTTTRLGCSCPWNLWIVSTHGGFYLLLFPYLQSPCCSIT